MSGPRGNTRCHPKLGLKFRTLGSPQVSVVGSLQWITHSGATVLLYVMFCMWAVWNVVTAAAQAVNEVWEPEAHSQLEKGRKRSRTLTVVTIPGVLPLSCFLAMWPAPGPCGFRIECVQALVFSVAFWRLAITARLVLPSTGHLIYQSLSTLQERISFLSGVE